MPRSRRPPKPSNSNESATSASSSPRIVGGRFRGRKLKYSGDSRVRPMKDRVREALFNLLGPAVQGTLAIDLFGGTGALALEALSRGAAAAIIVERHFPTARLIRENVEALDVADRVTIVTADSFYWVEREADPPLDKPWVVFCSPPYRLYSERLPEMVRLIEQLYHRAPPGSLLAVEAPADFDFGQLPQASAWDVRAYAPAFVGVAKLPNVVRPDSPLGSE